MAWKPDHDAVAIDSFTTNWAEFEFVYAFPPFSLIPQVLQKFREDKSVGLIVVPD